jgi:hypothetical protein
MNRMDGALRAYRGMMNDAANLYIEFAFARLPDNHGPDTIP